MVLLMFYRSVLQNEREDNSCSINLTVYFTACTVAHANVMIPVIPVKKLSWLIPLSTISLVPAAVLDYNRTRSRSTNDIFSRKDK